MRNRNGLTIGECLLATIAAFIGLVIAVAIVGPPDPPGVSSPSPSYTPPVNSSSDGLDWDAARRAGYTEEDIEAAKALHYLQQMDN